MSQGTSFFNNEDSEKEQAPETRSKQRKSTANSICDDLLYEWAPPLQLGKFIELNNLPVIIFGTTRPDPFPASSSGEGGTHRLTAAVVRVSQCSSDAYWSWLPTGSWPESLRIPNACSEYSLGWENTTKSKAKKSAIPKEIFSAHEWLLRWPSQSTYLFTSFNKILCRLARLNSKLLSKPNNFIYSASINTIYHIWRIKITSFRKAVNLPLSRLNVKRHTLSQLIKTHFLPLNFPFFVEFFPFCFDPSIKVRN